MTKRKTNEQFKKEIFDLVGYEYTFLDPYVNTHTKLRVKHNKCGNVYKVQPIHFSRGSRCPFCSGKAKKTDAEFKKEVFDLVGDEYTFLDRYVNAKTKLRVKHNKCNRIYEVQPYAFLQGKRCPKCFGNYKKTDADFKKEIYDLVGNDYVFLDSYVNAYTKIRVKHNECGNVYLVKPNNFINGSRCPYCFGRPKKTDAQFKREIYDLVGNEYVFLDPYVNDGTKLRVKHNKCGHTYKVKPNCFIGGSRCPFCCIHTGKTNIQFQQGVYGLVGNEYTFLDSYVNSDTKISVKHNKCGNVYSVRPTDFFSHHTRCPYCNSSKGETIISKILNTLNINYEAQKTFEDLRDKSYLSYDFYLPNQNILIEYQGLQHYEPVDHFGGESRLKAQQKHDQMKADYARDHTYNLIAVPYTEDTFSKIKKYLIKHGLTKL